MKPNIETFIGCESDYGDADMVIFGAPFDSTTSYRPGALNVYEKMNRYLEEFFLIRNDYDFRRQLKLHMIYYACNTVRMECGNAETFREAKQKVEMILRDGIESAMNHYNRKNKQEQQE